ncbi:inositol monophosphatase family protein [Cellulomonas sp. Leaf334]|uniref:inositol monophosphatase family protein n=1 Tax=Cellulomonas sp. Leaf334 TaxID=1736339 RepID=UPI0007002604|nr:inositol monophosphatase family protein [Cellulomonas sp. Leaf334]KQR17232.1 hypothetical protein ASF78_08010 [Cellulomonas sp. Leaf334]
MRLTDAEVAIAAAQAGAAVVQRDYGTGHVRRAKSGIDFATQTDIDAERAILHVLREHRPDDSVDGEELGRSVGASTTRRWLVDPLCGTLNFAATTPLSAVNVALSDQGQVIAAAVIDPIAADLFWTDGTASYVRVEGHDHALGPSSTSMLVDVSCDGPIDQAFLGGQLVADPQFCARFGPRVISSSLAAAWVAAGRRAAYVSDGHFRDNLHFAAAVALCESAGCVVSDLAGDALHTGRGLVIAADVVTHDAIVEIVRPHLDAGAADPSSPACRS